MIPAASTQLLLCIAADWDSPAARLHAFERHADEGWQPVGEPIPVTLGHHGLAWGLGLHPPMDGRAKTEGDGRAPAGIFPVTALFGPTAPPPPGYRLPFHVATPSLKCVDDPASRHYNCLVDAAALPPDWRSAEDMLRPDLRYQLGAVVAHNAAPPRPGAGSCIFLHVWESPDSPTAGCTAMALPHMQQLAAWLDGARSPLLVQLPHAEYIRLRADWHLPRR